MIRDYFLAWTGALMLYTLMRTVGTIELDGIEVPTGVGVLMSPLFGLIFGLFFGFVQIRFEKFYHQRIPLTRLLITRFVVSTLVLLLITLLAYVVFVLVFNGLDIDFSEFLLNPAIFIFYAYVIAVDGIISLIRQINLMLGPGTLKKLIKGQFYQPREEQRIFMFLDLKSSTEIAERLGHIRYSQLIQDCFNDLSVVTETDAEIYQYVGDEAVLTWPLKLGLKKQNCLRAFYLFSQKLDNRKQYYLDKYGHHPFFKAGLNSGLVTVAEVGRAKREIAYHGDTINTAARIQGMCNELEAELLISENLRLALNGQSGYAFDHRGDIFLRGKSEKVPVHAVSVIV